MRTRPFLSFPLRSKRNAIEVRYRARQIASLLRFSYQEQACIAAGTFAIACQALARMGGCAVCFRIEAHQLHVYANDEGQLEEGMMSLVKPLPEHLHLAEADLAWLVQNAENPPVRLFDELVKQNREVLSLLHELTVAQAPQANAA